MKTNEYRNISFSGAYDDGKELYVSSGLFNGMIRIDKKSKLAKEVKRFDNIGVLRTGLHNKVHYYKGNVVFCPDNAEGVHVYNIEEDYLKYYDFSCYKKSRSRCIDSFLNGSKLWLFFAYAEQPLIVFDLEDFTHRAIYWTDGILPKNIIDRKKQILWSRLEIFNRIIYGVIWDSPYIVQFDMDSNEINIISLEDEERRLSGIATDGETFWLTELRKTHVIKWKPSEKIEVIELKKDHFELREIVYCEIIYYEKKVILVPNSGENILYVSSEEEELDIFCKLPENFVKLSDERKLWRRFFYHDILENNILRLYPTGVNMMCDINLQNATIEGYEFCLGDDWDEQKYKEYTIYTNIEEACQGKHLVETKGIGLYSYLECVSNNRKSPQRICNVGSDIYQLCKN